LQIYDKHRAESNFKISEKNYHGFLSEILKDYFYSLEEGNLEKICTDVINKFTESKGTEKCKSAKVLLKYYNRNLFKIKNLSFNAWKKKSQENFSLVKYPTPGSTSKNNSNTNNINLAGHIIKRNKESNEINNNYNSNKNSKLIQNYYEQKEEKELNNPSNKIEEGLSSFHSENQKEREKSENQNETKKQELG
jgi:hypothetical protein